MMQKARIKAIFQALAEANPNPVTELEYTNPYTLMVAVVLSAQSTDIGVNKATKALFQKVDNPQAMLDLGLDGLKQHIKTIGLYNNKAKHIMGLSEKLIVEFNSKVPEDRKALESLPGVGRKTANVILNCAFGHPTIAVDTHVFRVSNRIGLVKTKNVLQTELALEKVIPASYGVSAHHLLILHGRYVCKARKPLCYQCSINEYCNYPDKTQA